MAIDPTTGMDLEPDIPEPIPSPSLTLPNAEFIPEQAQFLPYQPPGGLSRFLTGFAGVPVMAGLLANDRGRGQVPPLAYLLAGLLQGAGRARAESFQREEGTRHELNRRFTLTAAERNRANIAESRAVATEKRGELRRTAAEDRAQKRKEALERDPMLGPGDLARYGLPLSMAGKRVSELPPEARAVVAPRTSMVEIDLPGGGRGTVPATSVIRRPGAGPKPAGMKFGPVIPSLSALESTLGRQAQNAATTGRSRAADSLTTVAGSVKKIHAALREAQSAADVDLIQVPDGLDSTTVQELAKAARTRKAQLGTNAR